MIYFDPLFTANQKQWLTLEIPYVAQSNATNYVILSAKGDFVIDYEIDEVKTIPCVSAGGTFDPLAEAEKTEEKNHAKALDEQERAEQQSLRDGGKPSLEVLEDPGALNPPSDASASPKGSDPSTDRPEEVMGNNLLKDPVII